MMYERTFICPYTDLCENFKYIIRIEKSLQNTLWKVAWERPPEGSLGENDPKINVLENQLENVMRVKERCFNYHKRCMKFWQIKKKEERDPEVIDSSGPEIDLMNTRLNNSM